MYSDFGTLSGGIAAASTFSVSTACHYELVVLVWKWKGLLISLGDKNRAITTVTVTA